MVSQDPEVAVYDNYHDHTDDQLSGYDVILTIRDGKIVGELLQTIEGREGARAAVEAAQRVRGTGYGYAIVAPRWACGCRWAVFTPLGGMELHSRLANLIGPVWE
jgi:hypothetical protein